MRNKNDSYTVVTDISKLELTSKAFTEYLEVLVKMDDLLEAVIRKIYEEMYLTKFHLFKKSIDEFGYHHESVMYTNRYHYRNFKKYVLDEEIIKFFKFTYQIKPLYYVPVNFFNQLKYCVENNHSINISTEHNYWVENIPSDLIKLKEQIQNIELYLEKTK